MKKLTLNTDDLRVNSFQTAETAEERGTVNGAAAATYGQWTCGIWCPPTTDPKVTGPCAC
ncbi:MAG TPA: hypothetical protein VGC13_21255 [Longimicrobium sp.]|jgi:hypothetical protein|uniref:hypothetical protein n=1 Tax=Longimicrobium sp. TaxID=2029185 RepID=UPI002EDB0F2D